MPQKPSPSPRLLPPFATASTSVSSSVAAFVSSTCLWLPSPFHQGKPSFLRGPHCVVDCQVRSPAAKLGEDYLKLWDLILYWLRPPGFSTARDDSFLVTDAWNSLASQFWEGQLHTALKDGSVRHLFERTNSKYFGKGFEMLQVLEDNFRPSSISNSFTTLLALFNDTQGDKESIQEF